MCEIYTGQSEYPTAQCGICTGQFKFRTGLLINCAEWREILNWSLIILNWSLIILNWSLIIPNWSLIILNWSLIILNWSLIILNWTESRNSQLESRS